MVVVRDERGGRIKSELGSINNPELAMHMYIMFTRVRSPHKPWVQASSSSAQSTGPRGTKQLVACVMS